jgi:hypothetical protein
MKYNFLKLIPIAVLGLGVIGCGGGGGGSSSSMDLVKITTNNAEEVLKNYGFAGNSSLILIDITEYILSKDCESGEKKSVKKGDAYEVEYKECKLTGTNMYVNGKITHKNYNSNHIDILEYNNINIKEGNREYNIKNGNLFYDLNTGTNNDILKTNASFLYKVGGKESGVEKMYWQNNRDSSKAEYIINGYSKFYSVGKWTKIETQTKIVSIFASDECPKSGVVNIKGDSSDMKMVFNSDLTVSVSVNGKDFKKYSCKEFNKIMQSTRY